LFKHSNIQLEGEQAQFLDPRTLYKADNLEEAKEGGGEEERKRTGEGTKGGVRWEERGEERKRSVEG
jgi:hypothetical protein